MNRVLILSLNLHANIAYFANIKNIYIIGKDWFQN